MSTVHSNSLVHLISIPVFCCNSFNACGSLGDRICFGFVICISASCDLTSLKGYHWVLVRFNVEGVTFLISTQPYA